MFEKFQVYRIRVGGQFSVDERGAATGGDVGPDRPVSGVALASTAAVVEEESDDAQGFGHVPGQSGRQIIRSALNADRLLQSQPRHNQQL